MTADTPNKLRFLRRKAAAAKVGYSATHLMRLAKAGTFPKPVYLGDGCVVFVESEVEEWMKARVAERDASGSP